MTKLWPSVDVRLADTTKIRPLERAGRPVMSKDGRSPLYKTSLRLPRGLTPPGEAEPLDGWYLSFVIKPSQLESDGRDGVRPKAGLGSLTMSVSPNKPVTLYRFVGEGRERRAVYRTICKGADAKATERAVMGLCEAVGRACGPRPGAKGSPRRAPFAFGDLLVPKLDDEGVIKLVTEGFRTGRDGVAAAQAIVDRATEDAARAFAGALAAESVACMQASEGLPDVADEAARLVSALDAGDVAYDPVAEVALTVEAGVLWAAHVQRAFAANTCRGHLADSDPARLDRGRAVVTDLGGGLLGYSVKGAREALRDLVLGGRKSRMWDWKDPVGPKRALGHLLACDGAAAVGPDTPGSAVVACVLEARRLEAETTHEQGAADVIEAALDSKAAEQAPVAAEGGR